MPDAKPNENVQANMAHEAILQTLNRKVNGVYYDVSAFAGSVDAWAGVPLVYVPPGQAHPDVFAFEADPLSAIRSVNGRLVGAANAPHIEIEGHPRLMARLDWADDDEVQQLYREGRLSLSTAFKAAEQDGRLVGPVVPNHILLFQEDEYNMPGDRMSVVLNKAPNTTDAGKGIVAKLKGWLGNPPAHEEQSAAPVITAQANKEVDNVADTKEQEAKLAAVETELAGYKNKVGELEANLAKSNEMLAARDAQVAKLSADIEADKKAKVEAAWQAAKAMAPPGMVHGEKEAASRAEWETNKDAFYQKAFAAKSAELPGKEVGFEHQQKDDEKENAPRRTVGGWNAKTGTWEN